jgi:hypothetical protein
MTALTERAQLQCNPLDSIRKVSNLPDCPSPRVTRQRLGVHGALLFWVLPRVGVLELSDENGRQVSSARGRRV